MEDLNTFKLPDYYDSVIFFDNMFLEDSYFSASFRKTANQFGLNYALNKCHPVQRSIFLQGLMEDHTADEIYLSDFDNEITSIIPQQLAAFKSPKYKPSRLFK